MSIPTLERSKRRASSLITLKNLFQKFPKKLSSLLISLRNRNAYISFHFSCFLGLGILILGPPRINTSLPSIFSNSLSESAGRKNSKKREGEREREREQEIEEHVQGSTEEKFLCVVAHYRIEYRPHAAISAHRVTSSREIGMRKRKYRCLSRCGRRCSGEPNLPQRRF